MSMLQLDFDTRSSGLSYHQWRYGVDNELLITINHNDIISLRNWFFHFKKLGWLGS